MQFQPVPASARTLAQRFAEAARLRRQLRQPTGFRFAIADAICMLDAAQWDAVTKEASFFLQRDYLQMMEEAGPDNITPRYCLVHDGREAVAAIYMQITAVSGVQLSKPKKDGKDGKEAKEGKGGKEEVKPEKGAKRKKALALLKRALQPATSSLQAGLRERILVCGNLLSYGMHGIAFAPGVDAAAVWPAVAEALYRVRRAEKLAGQTDFVLIKDITPEALTEAGVELVRLENIDDCAQAIHQLYLQVHEQASLRMFTLPEVYFPALMHVAGGNARCTVARRDGQLLGFILTLKDGDTAFGYHIGFDKSANLPLYLRLLHAAVEDAIEFGCRRLSLGRTALEPKARLGCKPEEITVWLRHRQPVMNLFVRNLLRAVHHDEAPETNPFKK